MFFGDTLSHPLSLRVHTFSPLLTLPTAPSALTPSQRPHLILQWEKLNPSGGPSSSSPQADTSACLAPHSPAVSPTPILISGTHLRLPSPCYSPVPSASLSLSPWLAFSQKTGENLSLAPKPLSASSPFLYSHDRRQKTPKTCPYLPSPLPPFPVSPHPTPAGLCAYSYLLLRSPTSSRLPDPAVTSWNTALLSST